MNPERSFNARKKATGTTTWSMVSRWLIRLMWKRCRVGGIGYAFPQYSLVDFFPVNLDFGRRRDSDTYLITSYAQYCNSYIIADDKLLPDPSRQNKHSPPHLCV